MAPGIGCIDCSKQKKINKVSAQSRIDQDTDRVNQEVQTMKRKTANICIFFLSLVLAAQVLIPASAFRSAAGTGFPAAAPFAYEQASLYSVYHGSPLFGTE